MADGSTKQECCCIYELAETNLSPNDRDAFVKAVTEGEAGIEEIFKSSEGLRSLVTGINLVSFVVDAERECKAQ